MAFARADRDTAGWATRTAASGGLYQVVSDYGNIGAARRLDFTVIGAAVTAIAYAIAKALKG